MKLTGNTILITGGGTGIGRSLAEALHKLGNQVIVSGRRKIKLEETLRVNPGMQAIELDVADPVSIAAACRKLTKNHPELNVLINNAGIMLIDDVSAPVDENRLLALIMTNLAGPIRMTGALIDHLKSRPQATVINISSALGFVPMTSAAVYSSTKAALHSYSLSLRYRLKDSSVKVLEIAPPWVQTDLLNSNNEPRAMPLTDFIKQVMEILGTDAEEIVVRQAQAFRNNVGPDEGELINQFNDMMSVTN